MAVKPTRKMSMADRAKQFMPFSALKGLDEALKRKEHELENVFVFSDEQGEAINKALLKLNVQDRICITYRHRDKVITESGEVEALNKDLLFLKINGKQISFKDILNIKETENEKA